MIIERYFKNSFLHKSLQTEENKNCENKFVIKSKNSKLN